MITSLEEFYFVQLNYTLNTNKSSYNGMLNMLQENKTDVVLIDLSYSRKMLN